MKKVITYGTFDLFHVGHYNILKRAKEYGDYLIVGVTSESFDIERGKIGVRDSLPERIKHVQETGFADEIIIEEFQGQKIQDVKKYNIDVLVIGSDWTGKFDYLKPYCDVVYLERTKNISSTQLRISEQFLRFGIISETGKDNDFVYESKFVSGIHVDGVFNESQELAQQFCDEKELAFAYSDFNAFLNKIDAVYIQDSSKHSLQYAKKALESGKHVLFNLPVEWPEKELQSLLTVATEKKIVLMPCFQLAYSKALNQFVWMIESGVIGKLSRIYLAASADMDSEISTTQMLLNALYVFCRLQKIDSSLGLDRFSKSKMDNGGEYLNLYGATGTESVFLEIGKGVSMPSELSAIGNQATLNVPDDWWSSGYFEIINHRDKKKKRYSYNYEGSGIRYILQELLIMLREKKYTPVRFSCEECMELTNLSREFAEDHK